MFPAFLSLLPFLLHASLGVPLGDVARPRLLVTVAVESSASVGEPLLTDITTAARDIWRPYVDVVFAPAGSVVRTIEVDELRLVITGRSLNGSDESGLGWIEFVNGVPGRTITVSTSAVMALMTEASWMGRPITAWPLSVRRQFVTRALARSIAHEMGHYLLQSRVHTAQGLMRSRLTSLDVMEPTRVHDRLDEAQAATLWRRIAELARGDDGDRNRLPALPPS